MRKSSAASTLISIFICGILTLISRVGSHAPLNFRTSMLRPVLSRLKRKFLLPCESTTALGDDDGGSAHLPESDANLKNPNLWSSFRFFRGTLSSLRLPSEYGTVFQSGFPIAAAPAVEGAAHIPFGISGYSGVD